MSYLEGIKKLKKIETDYDVMSIRFKDVPIWPFLRIYLIQVLGHTNNETAHNISGSKIRIILQSLFCYSPICLLKKYPVWLFNCQERRKKIGTKWIHRVSGFFANSGFKFLDIEKPTTNSKHLKKKEIEESNIISEAWLILLSHFLERILRIRKLRVDNEDILLRILSTNNLQFNYKYFVRYLWAQKISTDFFLKLTGIPEYIFIECPYTIMGYQWSFKNHGIKIIELQHGVLNSSHYAYILPHTSIFSPDEIWVYGEREYEFFKTTNPNYANKIRQIGLYILERADKEFNTDIFSEYRKSYNKVIIFSGQTSVEEAIHRFLRGIAEFNHDYLFVYIPRYNNEIVNIDLPNVIVKKGINIYEYLKWCDLHVTV